MIKNNTYNMAITSQSCSISKQGQTGRTIYLKQRMSKTLTEYFPLSKDANFDYIAEFNDETKILTIRRLE